MKKTIKKHTTKRANIKTQSFTNKYLYSYIFIFIIGLLFILLGYSGGLFSSFSGKSNSINLVSTCTPKTICTRKLDGRKDCTTYECPVTSGGQTTTNITAKILNNDKVEYKYETVKTTPVNTSGTPTGNSTTVEKRTEVKPDKTEEVLSTVTTVQKPVVKDPAGKPVAPAEVVSEVRTGDITLGVSGYQSGDAQKKQDCEKTPNGKSTGKVWKNNKCTDPDARTPEEQCTKTEAGQLTGNTWSNNACVMKIVPKPATKTVPPVSTATQGVNCDKGTCGTSGSPICYGSYASTGQYIAGTTDYDCRLCGDNGAGGVGFVGESKSCKSLLADNAPVVLGYDANPAGLGLPEGTHTGSCLSKKGANWVLVAVGEEGDGDNAGKICTVGGGWTEKVVNTPPTTHVATTPEALCHVQHPGYIFGKDLDGKEVCIPRTTMNQARLASNSTCTPGKGMLSGREVYVECSSVGVPAYRFCSTSLGFDDNGICQIDPKVDNPLMGSPVVLSSLPNTPVEFFKDKPVRATMSTGVGAATGCVVGGAMGSIVPVFGNIVGCVVGGAVGAYSGNTVGNNISNAEQLINGDSLPNTPVEFFKDKPVRATMSTGVGAATGCVVGGAMGSIVPVFGNIVGCVVGGAVGAYSGNTVGNNISNAEQLINGTIQP